MLLQDCCILLLYKCLVLLYMRPLCGSCICIGSCSGSCIRVRMLQYTRPHAPVGLLYMRPLYMSSTAVYASSLYMPHYTGSCVYGGVRGCGWLL
jgi:hypothetical protein